MRLSTVVEGLLTWQFPLLEDITNLAACLFQREIAMLLKETSISQFFYKPAHLGKHFWRP
jgi:hypothetical protein